MVQLYEGGMGLIPVQVLCELWAMGGGRGRWAIQNACFLLYPFHEVNLDLRNATVH